MKNSQCLASNKNYQANEEAGEKSTVETDPKMTGNGISRQRL